MAAWPISVLRKVLPSDCVWIFLFVFLYNFYRHFNLIFKFVLFFQSSTFFPLIKQAKMDAFFDNPQIKLSFITNSKTTTTNEEKKKVPQKHFLLKQRKKKLFFSKLWKKIWKQEKERKKLYRKIDHEERDDSEPKQANTETRHVKVRIFLLKQTNKK